MIAGTEKFKVPCGPFIASIRFVRVNTIVNLLLAGILHLGFLLLQRQCTKGEGEVKTRWSTCVGLGPKTSVGMQK